MYQCNSPPAPELLKAQSLDELATSWFFRLVLPAWLPHSQSTSSCQLRGTPFSPMAVLQPVCNQLARLQSVSTAAQCHLLCSPACIISVQLQSVSSAVFCQLSCNVFALAYCVMQFICCDTPAARHKQLSYEVQAPLQSVISAAIRLLSHDLSAWQLSVGSVCQLSCNTAAQLRCVSSAQLSSAAIRRLTCNSAVRSAATCQLSCTLLAAMKLVISAATCWLSCSLSAHYDAVQQSVSSVVFCQLGCDMSAQQ